MSYGYVDPRSTVGLVVDQTTVMDAVGCYYCGVDAGSACLGVPRKNGSRRQRSTLHLERYMKYKQALKDHANLNAC